MQTLLITEHFKRYYNRLHLVVVPWCIKTRKYDPQLTSLTCLLIFIQSSTAHPSPLVDIDAGKAKRRKASSTADAVNDAENVINAVDVYLIMIVLYF